MQLCRSEDGINTMIVRADAGDLIMVYALVDRLADILDLEGNTEPADNAGPPRSGSSPNRR